MNNYRNDSFYNSVSVLDSSRQRQRELLFNKYVAKKFGKVDFRHNVKICNIHPDQCIPVNAYQKLYAKHHLNDVD
ncbi:hypothetical protein [Companilactobacillus furfuricola]|uniref:hypothetical protein n=1 Tax=Companilactobacillus furfuricola TaxID=1462575 RepID=UPI0013DE665F|nr:hypothetical protein [Companilactobacillus furfuricola]